MVIRSQTALLLSTGAAIAFLGAIALLEPHLARFPIGPDRPGMWYEWQLVEPSAAARASAWIGYALHQIAFWYLIWRAQHSGLR